MTPTSDRPVVLVVLDGWGYRESTEGNAIRLARTPVWDRLWAKAPRTLLEASGRAVGLPTGQMGNSEVGHMNLGAGRVVMQDLVRITAAVEDGTFFQNPAFVAACAQVKANGGTLHLMGLVGDGGVHAHQDHAVALVELAARHGVARVALHCLLDGRDTLPNSALAFTRDLATRTAGRARIASIGGRYYGMDRDQRWHRIEPWYRAAVQGTGPSTTDPLAFIQGNYDRNVTDEFMEPAVVHDADGNAVAIDGFTGFETGARPKLHVATMTQYDQTFGLPTAFEPFSMAKIMAEVLQEHGLTTLRTAETEKYPHVTYFFNGGNETPYRGEERVLVPSQKVATYDLMPEMSAAGITDVLCSAIEEKRHPFTLCNYANGDMVGHSGNLAATIRACAVVDEQLSRIIKSAELAGARLLVTADHGNCEMMFDPATGGPHTAHTTNPVPLLLVEDGPPVALRAGGALCDVGPTVLGMLGVPQPAEMTGKDLRIQGA